LAGVISLVIFHPLKSQEYYHKDNPIGQFCQ